MEEPKVEAKSSKLKWLKSKLPKYPILWVALGFNMFCSVLLNNLVGNDLTNEYHTVEPYVEIIKSIVNLVIALSPIVFIIWILWLLIVQIYKKKNHIEMQQSTSQFKGFTEDEKAFVAISGTFFVSLIYNFIPLLGCTVLLVYALLSRSFEPVSLIKDAAVIWLGNIFSFAMLYWGIDGGGPIVRKLAVNFKPKNFIFPEIGIDDKKDWKPNFFDYLFLSFNLAMSFSITDHSAVTRKAKACVIVETIISMIAVVVIAARAINILQ